MHTPNIREFNKLDWYSCAGARSFQEGSPLIVDDLPVAIIGDADGLEIDCEFFTYQVNRDTHPQVIEPFWNQEIARLCMLNLVKTWSRMNVAEIGQYCEEHGFVKVL